MDIMMESTNNEDETNISNNQIVAESAGQGGGAADHEERIHVDRGNNNNNNHHPLFFNEAPALRMNRMFSSAPAFEMLHSPVGSKRKAIDSPTARDVLCSSSQGENVFLSPLLRRKREERKTAMAATVTSQKTTEVSPSTTSRLGYGEPVSPKNNENEVYRRSWPGVSSMDDLDASLLHSSSGQGMPNNKRQRYQRRNSFFVHRDSNRRLAAASSILDDINRACFSGAGGGPADSESACSPPRRRTPPRRETNHDEEEEVVYNTEERRSFSPEGGDDSSSDNDAILPRSMTAGSKKPEDHEEVNFWGNASWSNSDDTRWYSEFSSLSFSSQPTLPPPPPLGRPPRTTTHPGPPENEGTSTTSDSTMLPPPPPRRQQVASSSLQGKHADHADFYSGRQQQQQQQQQHVLSSLEEDPTCADLGTNSTVRSDEISEARSSESSPLDNNKSIPAPKKQPGRRRKQVKKMRRIEEDTPGWCLALGAIVDSLGKCQLRVQDDDKLGKILLSTQAPPLYLQGEPEVQSRQSMSLLSSDGWDTIQPGEIKALAVGAGTMDPSMTCPPPDVQIQDRQSFGRRWTEGRVGDIRDEKTKDESLDDADESTHLGVDALLLSNSTNKASSVEQAIDNIVGFFGGYPEESVGGSTSLDEVSQEETDDGLTYNEDWVSQQETGETFTFNEEDSQQDREDTTDNAASQDNQVTSPNARFNIVEREDGCLDTVLLGDNMPNVPASSARSRGVEQNNQVTSPNARFTIIQREDGCLDTVLLRDTKPFVSGNSTSWREVEQTLGSLDDRNDQNSALTSSESITVTRENGPEDLTTPKSSEEQPMIVSAFNMNVSAEPLQETKSTFNHKRKYKLSLRRRAPQVQGFAIIKVRDDQPIGSASDENLEMEWAGRGNIVVYR